MQGRPRCKLGAGSITERPSMHRLLAVAALLLLAGCFSSAAPILGPSAAPFPRDFALVPVKADGTRIRKSGQPKYLRFSWNDAEMRYDGEVKLSLVSIVPGSDSISNEFTFTAFTVVPRPRRGHYLQAEATHPQQLYRYLPILLRDGFVYVWEPKSTAREHLEIFDMSFTVRPKAELDRAHEELVASKLYREPEIYRLFDMATQRRQLAEFIR